MTYQSFRHPLVGESFHDVLVEQLRRTPWLLMSAAVHGLVIVLLLMLVKDEPAPEPLQMAQTDLETVDDELDEPPPEIPPEVDPVDPVTDPVPVETPTEQPPQDDVDQDYEEEFGEQEDAFSDSSFDAASFDSPIGLGPGGGSRGRPGRGGSGPGGGGATRSTEAAVDRGLEWLARHQAPDGSWDADGFRAIDAEDCRCLHDSKGGALYDVGVTGLALLAFLGAGETHRAGPYKSNVLRALVWLRQRQDGEGCFGSRTTSNFTYNHAIAALAMTEAYGITRSAILKAPARRGLGFVAQCQNPYAAWRYGEANGDDDTSVTGWMVMALKAGKSAGLEVDPRSLSWAIDYIDEMTDDETGRTGYQKRGHPPVREDGLEAQFPASESESLTAVGITARIFAGQDPRESTIIRLGVESCLAKKLPVWDVARGSIDMYYWYYGTLAMYQVGGTPWRSWNRAMQDAIVDTQRDDGDFAGSWDPVGAWGRSGGRIYSTALMTLCLEVYYRYTRAFGIK